ncbi:MAG: PilZ domain-containing protein [Gammaproteobacteria bacterium]
MNRLQDDADFDGLALHDFLPLAWEPSTLSDPAELEHYNQETARALQALALFEEAPKELTNDANPKGQELQHLEAKVDVLLSLVTRLVSHQQGLPKRHNTVLRADSLEWTGPCAEQARTGDSGVIVLYPNPMLPTPFRLAGRVVSTVERGGTKWRLTRFEHLSPLVSVGLEKLVFRRHRRQVAIARGTDVFTKTGIHRAPKF